MADPQQQILLQGGCSTKLRPIASHSTFAREVDRELHQLAEQLAADEAPDPLHPMGSRRAQIEAELRQAINPEPLARQLRQALNVIARGSRYLGSAAHAMLVGELAKGIVNLGKVSSQLLRETNLMTTLGLDSDNMEAIAHLGAATYDEGLYPDCQALYVLLSTLHPENHDYWYRLGIAAQQNEQFELALRAYAASILLDPDSPAAHLFSAQCYLELGMKGDAQVEFLEAKRLAESLPEDSEMQHLVASVATLLQAEEQQGGE